MTLMVAMAVFSEELVYRSYLITRLTQLFKSSTIALVFSVVLFGLVHRDPAWMWFAALAGLVFGITFLWVGRIWPAAIGHFLYNMAVELKILS